MLQLHENLTNLRKARGVTQAQVADFIGVTKASVSKWETGQSYPDISLLPQLAAYYATTVDALLGYEPQLSKLQIQMLYHELANDFANEPYAQVLAKSEQLVKKYYACYPFLLQIALLWLNHVTQAPTPAAQTQLFEEIHRLCQHIQRNQSDLSISQDAFMLEAVVDLQLGAAKAVVERLEPLVNPYRFSQNQEMILIQAYQMLEMQSQAHRLLQINMFNHVLLLVNNASTYLNVHSDNWQQCQMTIARIDQVIAVYELEQLHPNTVAIYQYQVALVAMVHANHDVALKRLNSYVQAVCSLLATGAQLHGDHYFDTLDQWFAQADLGATPIRNQKLILASSIAALNHPSFAQLQQEATFQLLHYKLQKQGEKQ